MKASDIFIKALENEGIEYIFALPGEENLDLLDSIRQSSIKLIITRHEQAAGFMAATIGRLTGKPGVCLATLGPGATNLVTAAAYAQLGAMPMMMITGQKPIRSSKQGRFQIVDIVDMMRPLTKYTKQIVEANLIPSLIRDAVRICEQERPGAVHLELPEDIATEIVSDSELFSPHHPIKPCADLTTLKQAAEMIHTAKFPLVLIGAGANRKQTSDALLKLINKTGLYFFNTQMGKGVIDEDHAKFLGTAALSENDYIHCAINRADLIINIGHDVIEKPPFLMNHQYGKVIHINFFPAKIDSVYFPHLEVIGDISRSVDALADLLQPQKNWNTEYFEKIKNEVTNHIQQGATEDSFPLLPQRLVKDVQDVMPHDGILSFDNGMYKIWFARNYLAHQPNTFLLDNALASMGAGLPVAIAAKILHPEKAVLAICGDGGFMMNSQELETAVRLKLNLCILILHDNGYGMIQWKQEAMGLPAYGLEFTNPDFVQYAQSYGAHGHRVETTAEFVPILENCLATPGVHVIDVPVDYSHNFERLNKELLEKTCIL